MAVARAEASRVLISSGLGPAPAAETMVAQNG
jgi:hypothetical protein